MSDSTEDSKEPQRSITVNISTIQDFIQLVANQKIKKKTSLLQFRCCCSCCCYYGGVVVSWKRTRYSRELGTFQIKIVKNIRRCYFSDFFLILQDSFSVDFLQDARDFFGLLCPPFFSISLLFLLFYFYFFFHSYLFLYFTKKRLRFNFYSNLINF